MRKIELVIPISIAKSEDGDYALVLGVSPMDYDLILPIDVENDQEASEFCDEIAEKLGFYVNRVMQMSVEREEALATGKPLPPAEVMH